MNLKEDLIDMTRLKAEHIKDIKNTCGEWDHYLKSTAGIGFLDIAARVSGRGVSEIQRVAETFIVYVIPVTSGLGRISGFSESVAAIIRTMGFEAPVSKGSDIDGIYEAYRNNADIVFLADDKRYIALNLKNGRLGENNMATALGYAEVLESFLGYTEVLESFSGAQDPAAGGLNSRDVLVIGYGALGRAMTAALGKKEAKITVYDKDKTRLVAAEKDGRKIIRSKEEIKNFDFIADATSEGGWLGIDLLSETPVIAAPGIPLSLDRQAQEKHKDRVFYDMLEIGTAAMLGLAV